MSARTQQGKYQMVVRADIYHHTIDVNSYPCQLVPLIDVNSYHKLREVMSNRTQQGDYQIMVRVDFSYQHNRGLPKTLNILTDHLRTGRSIAVQFTPPHQSVTVE